MRPVGVHGVHPLPGVPSLPWLIWAGSVVLTGIGILFYLRNGAGPPQPVEPVTPMMALVFPGIGALIVSRERSNGFGWAFVGAAVLGVAFCAEQYATYTLFTAPGALPAGRWTAWLATWLWAPSFLVLRTVVFLLFPYGRPPSPGWRPVAAVVLATVLATTVVAALAPGPMGHFAVDNPVGVAGVSTGLAGSLSDLCVLVLAPVCVAGLVLRYRRSVDRERAQLRWFAAASVVVGLLPLVGLLVRPGILRFSQFHVLAMLALLTLPAAVVLAIMRFKLYDLGVSRINALATGSLVAPGLFLAGLTLYWVIADLLEAPPVAALAMAGVALQPTYRLLRGAVTRFLAAARAQSALFTLGQRLGSTAPSDTILSDIVRTVGEAFEAGYVGLAVQGEDGVTIAREMRGEAVEAKVVVPLVFRNQTVGELALEFPDSEQSLDLADKRLLEDLSGQLAVAVFGVRQTAALQRAKQEAVATLEHERLCWRDAIHDTLKPTLIGITGILDGATAQLVECGDHARSRIRERLESVNCYVQNLLDAVDDLDPNHKPRTVGELGLAGAIRQRIATFGLRPRAPVVTFDLVEETESRIPTTIEVRAYLIVCQAMENVDRHAEARRCWVTVRLEEDFVDVEVCDNGKAPPGGYQAGQGIRLMARLAANDLEDEFRIAPRAEGGTMVLARLRIRA